MPPGLESTEALAEAVRTHRLRVNLVLGVHGRMGTWAQIEQSLREGR